MTVVKHIICHQCDLLMSFKPPAIGSSAFCPRCQYLLTTRRPHALDHVMAFSLSALLFLFLANCFAFLSINVQGQEQTITLLQSINILINQKFIILAVLIFIPVIVVPMIYLLAAFYVSLSLKRRYLLANTKPLMKLTIYLQQWNMAEIFLIGILVSFIKIMSLADIRLGISFWAYVLFIISMTMTMLNIDKYQFWQWIKEKEGRTFTPLAAKQNVHLCPVCGSINPSSNLHCNCCGTPLHSKFKHSLQKTWAWLITAIILYIPANFLPIMKMKYLGVESSNTILGGVFVLWQHGSYPIAVIIFMASVLIPMAKIITLSWLCFSVQLGGHQFRQQKTLLYRRTKLLGRWSMIDVFVVVILVALIRMGDVMSIYPDWGAVAFGALVIVTILAAMSFDPRLIWYHQPDQQHNPKNLNHSAE